MIGRIAAFLLLAYFWAAPEAVHADSRSPWPEGTGVAYAHPHPTADGRLLVIQGGGWHLWSYKAYQSPQQLASPPFGIAQAYALSPDLILGQTSGLRWAQYSVTDDRWIELPAPSGLSFGTVISLSDGRALATYGSTPSVFNPQSFPVVYLYDSRVRQWTQLADAPGLYSLPTLLRDGRVHFWGGNAIFDPVGASWSVGTPLPLPPQYFGNYDPPLAISGNRIVVLLAGQAIVYDVNTGQASTHQLVARRRVCDRVTVLPNGRLLISGGQRSNGGSAQDTQIIDTHTWLARSGAPMAVGRACHRTTTLPDGQVLMLGGQVQYHPNILPYQPSVWTASVESYPWEPEFIGRLPAGSYTATVTQAAGADNGFWGLEVQTSGSLDGGLNFGGMLDFFSAEPGFAAFFLPTAQTVNVRADMQRASGNGSSRFGARMRILDAGGQLVAGPVEAEGNLTLSAELAAGFHVVELDALPPLDNVGSFQVAVSAPRLSSGGSTGGLIMREVGVTGFLNFYLASEQDVSLRLSNRGTYGDDRGAGELIMTLMDGTGRVVARLGPGTLAPAP
jgi:hypothetical protein